MVYLTYAGLYAASLIGMIAHFAKKKIKGESVTEVANYFKDNAKSTLLAFIATTLGFVLLVQTGDLSVISAFGVGYVFDSVLNKWDNGNGV